MVFGIVQLMLVGDSGHKFCVVERQRRVHLILLAAFSLGAKY